MNNAEKYVYAVYRKKSFSEAAKGLYISQPALSSAVKNHEEQLGYKIFNRSTSPITLTTEGNVYIEYLEELLYLEKQLNERLQSVSNKFEKKLSIGGSKSAAFSIIPKLCSEFHRRFPDVSIKIDAGGNGPESDLFDKLSRGVLDFVVSTSIGANECRTLLLKQEKYMIVMPKSYPGAEKLQKYALTFDELTTGIYSPEKEIDDLNLFRNVKLFRPSPTTKAGKVFSKFYKIAAPEPCRIVHFHKLDMQYNLMKEGMGAIIMPQNSIIERGNNEENLYYFDVKLPDNTRDILLVYKDNAPISPYAEDFISLAKEIFPQR